MIRLNWEEETPSDFLTESVQGMQRTQRLMFVCLLTSHLHLLYCYASVQIDASHEVGHAHLLADCSADT